MRKACRLVKRSKPEAPFFWFMWMTLLSLVMNDLASINEQKAATIRCSQADFPQKVRARPLMKFPGRIAMGLGWLVGEIKLFRTMPRYPKTGFPLLHCPVCDLDTCDGKDASI